MLANRSTCRADNIDEGLELGNGDDLEYVGDNEEYREVPRCNQQGAADSDGSDVDRDQELLQSKCLPVSGAPLPPGSEPAKDADEYLRQVMWERLHAPQTVEAEVQEEQPRRRKKRGLVSRNGSILAQFEAPSVPEEVQHSREWAEDVADAFRRLRNQCAKARRMADTVPSESAGAVFDTWRERCLRERPSMKVLSEQDLVSINHLVVVVVEAIVEATQSKEVLASGCAADGADPALCEQDGPRVEWLESLAEWAYAALAFVDQPLADDIQYQLQRLRRSCLNTIAAVHTENKDRGITEGNTNHVKASVLLVIVTEVFGQR